jgi:hypothetical protein
MNKFLLIRKENCKNCNKIYVPKSNNSKHCSSSCKYKFYRKGKTYKKKYKEYIISESFKNSQNKYKSSEHGSKKLKEIRKKYQPIANFKARTIYSKTDKGKRLANYHCALRYSRKKQRIPKWINEEEKNKIKLFYFNRPNGYEVDHIIPLCGKNVSGLHTFNNLQYLTSEENRSKNNKFEIKNG